MEGKDLKPPYMVLINHIKYNVLIFEIRGRGRVGEGCIGNENERHRLTKLIQQIMISYLISHSSPVPLSLSLFSSSISLSTICIIL